MSKRRKYPRLPSGFGSIAYLGRGRRNPYGVYPPCNPEDTYENGHYRRPKALCYVPDYYTGFAVLSAYNAGTYVPGMELDIIRQNEQSRREGTLADRSVRDASMDLVLTAYNAKAGADRRIEKGKTFDEIYQEWFGWKYESPSSRDFSVHTKHSVKMTYKHLDLIKDRHIEDLTLEDMQEAVDCIESLNIRKMAVGIVKQISRYALMKKYIKEDCSVFVKCGQTAVHEKGSPFTADELATLWENENDDTIGLILIMVYSGFRIGELKGLDVNLDDLYFKGGIKTENSRDRIVPIHSAIIHLVRQRMQKYGCISCVTEATLRDKFHRRMKKLGIKGKSPHDTRHTFSMLLEAAGVTDSDRKRLLGHALTDVTNGVYGHRTVEQLRESLEMVRVYR